MYCRSDIIIYYYFNLVHLCEDHMIYLSKLYPYMLPDFNHVLQQNNMLNYGVWSVINHLDNSR